MAIWGGHGVRRRGEFWVREGYGDGWKRPREVRVLEGWEAGEKGGNDAIMLDIFYSKKG